jgi:hypothetical protein
MRISERFVGFTCLIAILGSIPQSERVLVTTAGYYDLKASLSGEEQGKRLDFSARLVETGGKRLASGRDFTSNGTLRPEVAAGEACCGFEPSQCLDRPIFSCSCCACCCFCFSCLDRPIFSFTVRDVCMISVRVVCGILTRLSRIQQRRLGRCVLIVWACAGRRGFADPTGRGRGRTAGPRSVAPW